MDFKSPKRVGGKLHNLSKSTGFFASLGCRLLAVDSAIAKRLKPLTPDGVSSIKSHGGGAIAGILAGETQLYHELIRPHERSVYLLALSYVKNEADAEDVAQEAFVRAFRNLASFRAESKFSTWLISITLNEATSRLRRQSVILMESLDEPPDENRTISRAFLPDWRERPRRPSGEEVRKPIQQQSKSFPTFIVRCFYYAM